MALPVGLGSKQAGRNHVGKAPVDVRFTPESGHRRATVGCPLSAKSRHLQGQPRRLGLLEYEACSHRRVDHLIAERLSREIIETIPRAMPCDQIIRVDALEFLEGFADVVVTKRRNDMKSADHGMHFIYSGCGDRLTPVLITPR